ncbi:sigma 54-interacting transcriptional regulator [Geothrix sp. 21YS21S-2]|uniref:sigma-54-dependent Fis family transcriptional regulator n=1 Tax=Geothrix sp. 21YS21S-2 TaxID=3068893 RepID=UPI0027B99476|nr:sigma 54-interacting transcriptional regulator [Geothrix sp. 21YS21S-2]
MTVDLAGREMESARIDVLRRYQIMDTPPDGAFDHVTAVAAELLRVPIAIVSLVDTDRIWFKSHHGLEASGVEREPGLCASAILSEDIYEVRDAKLDARSLANPLVAGAFGLRFYAAAPLRTHDGFNLGTLCVIDREPRELTGPDARNLEMLAALVMDLMELRLAARKIAELEEGQREISEKLRQAVAAASEQEQQFRDLFDEAPVPYVFEGLDTRFIHINRAAMRILGVKPEEVTSINGATLLADTPENKASWAAAKDAIDRGIETKDVILELHRKDNGQSVWVKWWSKPVPGLEATRTVIQDITEQVLLEREQARLQAQNEYLLEELRDANDFGDIIGESPGLRKVMQQMHLVAPTDAAVLITGESGTGKELVARAIHDNSLRKLRPLIKVNCSAVPESLFESEFFGHMRGAFTGAVRDKPGRFELADGGTLFLDEIGEIPLAMQAKLLRVLQEHELERIGDTRTRKVDVRIIAATNRDLIKEVEAGRFRQDLYYRLVVFPLAIPPLRERCEDISKLATHFVRATAKKMNRKVPPLTLADAERLTAYEWPGNIRELQNAVERAVILAGDGPLSFDLPRNRYSEAQPSAQAPSPLLLTREAQKNQERESIIAALKQAGGKVFGTGGAAEILAMKPTTLASRIKALGIEKS